MNEHDMTEIAYRNGYEAGIKESAKWISVKDRLPKKDGWYLAYINFEGGRHQRIDVVHFDSKDMYFNYVWSHHIYFWMPLPEPPKEMKEVM